MSPVISFGLGVVAPDVTTTGTVRLRFIYVTVFNRSLCLLMTIIDLFYIIIHSKINLLPTSSASFFECV